MLSDALASPVMVKSDNNEYFNEQMSESAPEGSVAQQQTVHSCSNTSEQGGWREILVLFRQPESGHQFDF